MLCMKMTTLTYVYSLSGWRQTFKQLLITKNSLIQHILIIHFKNFPQWTPQIHIDSNNSIGRALTDSTTELKHIHWR